MVSFPPWKITLGLNIISRRPDGYHDLVTCFYPVQWTDILEIIPSDRLTLSNSGLNIPGDPDGNLIVKAYHLLKDEFNLPPVSIHLHKIIPMGAGLGGGSSDAAWTLRMLNKMFDLKLDDIRLKDYASRLGSDCSFFMDDKPMLGTGRGEILSAIQADLTGKFIVIIKPAVHISTAEAYTGITPEIPKTDLKAVVENLPVTEWKNFLSNDFEKSVFKKYPHIGDLKKSLYNHGASYASMSGSGAAVFGIFENKIDLQDKFPDVTYWSGQL